MGYEQNFYKRYEKYLQEPTVRFNHDRIFEHFSHLAQLQSAFTKLLVVDLGCGIGEYQRYGCFDDYVGVDCNQTGRVSSFINADYHNVGELMKKLKFRPNAFVSLFSIECCHSAKGKYALYEKIFAKMPRVQHGLVGGFFYESKRDQEIVGETGGINSYQTIEDPSLHISKTFSEFRTHVRTPSRMFGRDVVEVWKILSRS